MYRFKILRNACCLVIFLNACGTAKKATGNEGINSLSGEEKRQGWQLLFDGKTTAGWHTYNKAIVTKNWKVTDGSLEMDAKEKTAGNGGDIVTDKEFENYELSLQWRISEGGNSGIIFNIQEDSKFGNTYNTGPEMQVLDNIKAEDNKKENHLAGLLYDITGTAALSNPKPVGEWNNVRIIQNNGHLIFKFNDIKTLDVQLGSDEWKTLIAGSKFKTWQNFAVTPKGKIAFQDHGHEVAFRNIKIRQL